MDELNGDGALNVVLEAELARLPAEYREPLLLCYLQGQSQARAAQTLGWPIGTVAGRLSRAKELLKSRLVRRGVTPAVVAALGMEQVCAHVPVELLEKTLKTIPSGGASTLALLAKGGLGNMWMSKWLILGTVGTCLTLGVGAGYSAWSRMAQQDELPVKEVNSLISPVQKKQDEHPDYQAIQGRWRCETRNEVTDTLLAVQDMTFRERKYVRTAYSIDKNGRIIDPSESSALEFVLDPSHVPKRIELQEWDLVKRPFPLTQELKEGSFIGRYLCNYELKNDTLTIIYGGKVPLKRNDKDEVFEDRNSPLARYPTDGKDTVKFIYHRMPGEKNAIGTNPSATAGSDKESKERSRLLQERVQASEMIFKLRQEAYRSGKESVIIIAGSIHDRLEAKLELANHLKSDARSALQEAIDSAKLFESIANTKYKSGSGTQLDYVTVQFARLGYELRLLNYNSQGHGTLPSR